MVEKTEWMQVQAVTPCGDNKQKAKPALNGMLVSSRSTHSHSPTRLLAQPIFVVVFSVCAVQV